jgi:exopolyphosphatase
LLSLAGLQPDLNELLCITDLPNKGKPFPSSTFTLVDHNRLGPAFSSDNPTARVAAIIDHHTDEGLHTDTADPRIIVPAGSCASLVARLPSAADTQIPPPLASLLLSAILIDTNGLKPGGKATPTDTDAAALLLAQSTLAPLLPPVVLAQLHADRAAAADALHALPALRDLAAALADKKESLAALGTLDLLRRDYKEYALARRGAAVRAGLSSVPRPLAACDDLATWARAWMAHRGLAVLGVLTSFHDEHKLNKSGKPKHRREQAWLVHAPSELKDARKLEGLDDGEEEGADGPPEHHTLDLDELASALWIGLEASSDLGLERHPTVRIGDDEGRERAYKQGNSDATRKVTAPLLKSIVEGTSATPSHSSL